MLAFVLCALAVVSKASVVYQAPYYVSTGTSNQYRNQDVSGNYRFGYDESHASGGTFRDERGDAWGNKYGSYGLREADGRYRVVNYVADENGFRADVQTNEPGVAPKDPASATFTKTEVEEPIVQSEKSPIITQKPILYSEQPIVYAEKPLLYGAPSPAFAPVFNHAYNPEYPLLYQYQTPYYAPFSTYKGTPFRRFGTNFPKRSEPIVVSKGSPVVVSKVSPVVSRKGSPVVSTKGSPAPIKGSPVTSTKGSSVKGVTVVSRKGAPYISNQGYFFYP